MKLALLEKENRGKTHSKRNKSENESTADENFEFDPMFDDIDDMQGRRPLPSKLTPNAWAGAALFLLLSVHALKHLLCRWFVWFDVMMNYEPVEGKIAVGMFVAVTPKKYRGKAGIEAITRSDRTHRLVFWFQRQKFEVLKESEILENLSLIHI